jgi:hypothetical protein
VKIIGEHSGKIRDVFRAQPIEPCASLAGYFGEILRQRPASAFLASVDKLRESRRKPVSDGSGQQARDDERQFECAQAINSGSHLGAQRTGVR